MKENKIDYEKILKNLQETEFDNMSIKYWCNLSCNSITSLDTRIEVINEKILVKGEMFEIEGEARFCSKCNIQISDIVLDDLRLENAYNQYRKKHRLLMPEEITEIYKKYNLTAKGLAEILNFGDNTIYRYEKGALQDKVHDAFLKQISKPNNMLDHINNCKINISKKAEQKLRDKIEKLMIEDLKKMVDELVREMKKEEKYEMTQIGTPIYNKAEYSYIFNQQSIVAA
ncbi:MAG: hypothetical protein FWC11_06000 [Firmicutes bacterium]|nr:hypothetical protein [Bacillota bacterium]